MTDSRAGQGQGHGLRKEACRKEASLVMIEGAQPRSDMRAPMPGAPGPAVRVFRLEDLRAAREGWAEREALDAELLHSFGPSGTGIIAISGVPRALHLRERLLSVAPRVASMPMAQLKALMKVSLLLVLDPHRNPTLSHCSSRGSRSTEAVAAAVAVAVAVAVTAAVAFQ